MNEHKIINDPVFGFIKIPQGLIYNIVEHPLMQRLNRINQLGLASVVYPGARHTRFQHSLGAFHLMSEAILSLQQKGNFIFDSEAEAVEAAILMHDIGHGPFSHVLENTLIHGISHEEISLMMMEQINRDMGERLNLAISIFKGEYPKQFLHQLISSQSQAIPASTDIKPTRHGPFGLSATRLLLYGCDRGQYWFCANH